MDAAELRNLAATLYAELAERDTERSTHAALVPELKTKQLKIDQLTHEMAILKRYRFDRRSEQMDVMQRSLLDESIDADIEAISLELDALNDKPASPPKQQPRRVALPAGFPRREIRHEPENTQCSCGCGLERIGEDVSEKLYEAASFFRSSRFLPLEAGGYEDENETRIHAAVQGRGGSPGSPGEALDAGSGTTVGDFGQDISQLGASCAICQAHELGASGCGEAQQCERSGDGDQQAARGGGAAENGERSPKKSDGVL